MECLAATGGPSLTLTLVLAGVGVAAVVGGLLMARRGRRATATLVFVLALGLSLSGVAFGQAAPASAATSCEDPGVPTAPGTTSPSSPSATPTPTPTPTPVACPVTDKSATEDTDADGVTDACDLDSDNDGILDAEEDLDANGRFEDDDIDGDILITPVLGDGIACYLDLDSENDGVLDLMEGRPFTRAEIDAFDSGHDGILDATLTFGANGLLDDLETSPDSGVLKAQYLELRNTDGDDKYDFFDALSNGTEFDLYAIGRSDLDLLGGGVITPIIDADEDGIMDTVPAGASPGADTDSTERGAPGSPYSPYSS